jgi:hypothetical protein
LPCLCFYEKGGIPLRKILIVAARLLSTLPLSAQYPGQLTIGTPALRAIAVLMSAVEYDRIQQMRTGKQRRKELKPAEYLERK